jgi:hypothetical protein
LPKIHPKLRLLDHVHSDDYVIWDPFLHDLCGPCFFREGFRDELPSRVTIREGTGNYGAPAIDPRVIRHIELTLGLVPPRQGQSLPRWRRWRDRFSKEPSPEVFPFASALWLLMNFQPPLAKPLVKFCYGMNEVEISEELDLSLYNVHERLSKAVRTGQRFLNAKTST